MPISNELRALIAAAELHMSAQDYLVAVGHWQGILEGAETPPRGAYHRLAIALWKLNRFKEAEQILENAMLLFPDFAEVRDLFDTVRSDRASRWKMPIIKLSNVRLHIDTLRDANVAVTKENLVNFQIKGWVQRGADAMLVAYGAGGERQEIQFAFDRPDVQRFLAGISEETLLRCGFEFSLDVSKGIRVALSQSGKELDIFEIRPSKVFQVKEGKEGWLFLDNDTNKSSDIFTGKVPLTPGDVAAWASFAREARDAVGADRFCSVIAPSKEDVFPELHPEEASSFGMSETVAAALFADGLNISCPIRRLRQDREAFIATDTHWSDLGAVICAIDIMEILGVYPAGGIEFEFREVEAAGDLGSKMTPPRKAKKKVLPPLPSQVRQVFDNQITSSGGIQIFENDAPAINKSILIFGGSSSSHLTSIFARTFARTGRINSPTTMPVMEVVDLEKPDYVIAQTNARYLKTVPSVTAGIAESTLAKLIPSQLPEGWRSAL